MRRPPMRILVPVLITLMGAGGGVGCGEDCEAKRASVQVRVDGRAPGTCANWVLEVRTCSTGGSSCEGGCGPCVDGAPDPACEPIDACDDNQLSLPPGDYRACVHAELVNGGLAFDGDPCADFTVPDSGDADPVPLAVETGDAFPCIAGWSFNGSACCNPQFGCVPPDA